MKKILLISFLTLIIIPYSVFAQETDSDNDGLTDKKELSIYFTNPNIADTDDDGYSDKQEINDGYSPTVKNKKLREVDTDKDDLDDEFELKLETNLNDSDSDDDGYWDGIEVATGYNPLDISNTKVEKIIKINLKEQKLAYYFGKIKLDEFLISSGVKSMPTPKGKFEITKKDGNKLYKGSNYYYPDTKWNLGFKPLYYIHGAYWHNNFGKPMSHGCINVAYENMERLYYWAQIDTKVEIS